MQARRVWQCVIARPDTDLPETFSHNTRVQLKQVFDALRALMAPPDPPKRPIGFVHPEDKGKKSTARSKS